jgi:hypothetical protein
MAIPWVFSGKSTSCVEQLCALTVTPGVLAVGVVLAGGLTDAGRCLLI